MKFNRQLKYYYLRFIRLKGEPNELALGMALGVFTGMMPIMPFQIALAVTLALFLKGSKITAAIGTWISNPLNWYLIYFYDYKLGASLLGIPQRKALSGIIQAMKSGHEPLAIVSKILEAGGAFAAAFLLGGLILGLIFAPPAYFFFLHFFRYVRQWRLKRRRRKEAEKRPPFNTA